MLSQDEQWLLHEKYGGEKSDAFFADLERLQADEPLGYVIGFVPFLDCKIWLDSKPLIPRPETEYWTEKAIQAINTATEGISKHPQRQSSERGPAEEAPQSQLSVLDLCAGSGCIGVAVLKHTKEARVDFSEIDARHLPTIGKNLAENDISCTHYHVWQSDLFANISDRYDFILSNPPYIDPALDRTEPSVKDHEPHHALYGGRDGLEFIEHIIAGAPSFLNPQGQLWLEHEPEQVKEIATLAEAHSFSVTTYKDQFDSDRYSVLVLQ